MHIICFLKVKKRCLLHVPHLKSQTVVEILKGWKSGISSNQWTTPPTVFARLSASCGCKLVKLFCSRDFVKHLYNRTPQWVPIALRTQCCFPDKARGKVCDLVWVTSGGKFNMRRRSLALAGHPKSAKNRGGGALIQDSVLNRANTVLCFGETLRYLQVKVMTTKQIFKCLRSSMIFLHPPSNAVTK